MKTPMILILVVAAALLFKDDLKSLFGSKEEEYDPETDPEVVQAMQDYDLTHPNSQVQFVKNPGKPQAPKASMSFQDAPQPNAVRFLQQREEPTDYLISNDPDYITDGQEVQFVDNAESGVTDDMDILNQRNLDIRNRNHDIF